MMRKLMLSTLALVIGVPAFVSVGRAEDKEAQEILKRAIRTAGGERTLARLVE